MRKTLDLVFTERAIRRALGVAILGVLMAAVGYVKRGHVLDQSVYLTSDLRVWSAWVATGAVVAGVAFLFVALGLLVGRSPVGHLSNQDAELQSSKS